MYGGDLRPRAAGACTAGHPLQPMDRAMKQMNGARPAMAIAAFCLAGLTVPSAAGAQQPTVNTRMLPDISVVGDFIGDFSPKRSTQNDGTRFGIRHVEILAQAAVDPYF